MQADAGQRRGEQIPLAHAPEDRAFHPRQDARDEQNRRRPMHRTRAAAGDLVQGAHPQAACGKVGVQAGDPEWNRALGAPVRALYGRNPRPQRLQ